MGNFKKFDNNRGGRGFGGGFGGDRGFGGHGDRPRQMHPATCSKCGQSCEVPFKPNGSRPVFCNNCFKSQGDRGPTFAPKIFARDNQSKAQFDLLNAKLDKILALLVPAAATEAPQKEPAKKEKKAPKKTKGKKK